MFQQDGQNFGFDLFAIDLQRGRDHGIPPYGRFREICNLSPVTTFADLEGVIRPHSLEVIQRFYKSDIRKELFKIAVILDSDLLNIFFFTKSFFLKENLLIINKTGCEYLYSSVNNC